MKEIDATSSSFSSKWLVDQGIVEAYESSGRLLLIRGIHSSPEEESPVSHLRAVCGRCRDEVESCVACSVTATDTYNQLVRLATVVPSRQGVARSPPFALLLRAA